MPSPSAFPAQTPIAQLGVTPTAQASLKPKLVPVFQATHFDELNARQKPSSSGRLTAVSAWSVSEIPDVRSRMMSSTCLISLRSSSPAIGRMMRGNGWRTFRLDDARMEWPSVTTDRLSATSSSSS